MAKAIQQLRNGLTVGRAGLGERGEPQGAVGSVRQQVYDGDTVTVRAIGNFGVRFLGVDAPELAIPLPGGTGFTRLSDAAWERFLTGPLAGEYPPFEPALEGGLVEHLRGRTGAGTAENHYRHAEAAEDALEAEVLADIEALGTTEDDFEFFLAFAHEVVDRYGRLLCYVNRRQPDEREPAPRPPSYNERLLATGAVLPYFIWPNVDPFREAASITEAVFGPDEVERVADGGTLGGARRRVREARAGGSGVFEAGDPLRLEAFEVRYLARRRPPERWVIDLLRGAEDRLLPPQDYYRVANAEDRLYVAAEHVPLFVEAGWRR